MLAHILALQLRRVEIVEIINDRHTPTAFGQQTINQMRTDKTCAACDENIFHVSGQWSVGSAFQLTTDHWLLRRVNPQVPAPARGQSRFHFAREQVADDGQPAFVQEMCCKLYL